MKSKIIYLEDDKFVADSYHDKLIEAGFEVKICYLPNNSFINTVISFKPDLVIIGLLFPNGVDGFEITKAIRNNAATKNIKIIGFDNWTKKEEIDKLKELGMNDYVIRSNITPETFVDYIKEYLSE